MNKTNWKHFWEGTANKAIAKGSKSAAVGRVVNGEAMSAELLTKISAQIALQLKLGKQDHLLDVCCGNGALSKLLLPYVASVKGVDFSETLIGEAKAIGSTQMEFYCEDAASFTLDKKFNKILLYFSFQYFESYAQGKAVLANLLKHAAPGAIILIGDIPNQQYKLRYYNTPRKWWQWVKQYWRGNNDMGKFWHKRELLLMCHELGVKGEVLHQESWQPYAHYRFDLLVYS